MNESQLAAVNHRDGPLQLIAAAGSGKTTVLTERTKALLAGGIPGHQILCCTFTKKAAMEMSQRIRKATGKKVDVTTIHALARRMLLDEMEKSGIQLKSDLRWIIERALISKKSKLTIEDVEAEINVLKSKLIRPGETEHPEMRAIYSTYESIKEQKKYYDFNDLLIHAVDRMKNQTDFRKKWQKVWQFVMVDEFQDTNRAQWELIRLLAQRHRNVMTVGDDYQAIFKFNGADPSLMMNFKKEYPNVRTIIMGINYRSRQTILDVADAVISLNANQIHKDVVANRIGGEPPCIVYVDDEEVEAKQIVRRIRKIKDKNPELRYSDFAILYRTNQQSRPFEEALLKANIPCTVFGDRHFYALPSVVYLTNCMRAIETLKYGKEPDTAHLVDLMRLWIARYETILHIQNEGFQLIEESKQFAPIMEKLDDWINIEEPEELLDHIYRETPDGKQQAEQKEENKKVWFESLKKSAAKFDSVADFLHFIDRCLERSKENNEDAVQLMTIHRSKGLEFHTVFLADMLDGFLPYRRALEEGNIEEETRLGYVGITRAKDDLYLMVPKQIGDTEYEPSRYIEVVEPYCRKEMYYAN